MWTPPHSHTLTPRPKKPFTPLLPGHILRLRGCLETRRSGISPSGNQPKPNLRPKAPRLNPVFSPKRAVGRRSGRSWRGGRRDPVVPFPLRDGGFILRKPVLGSRWRRCGGILDVVCLSSLTHSSSHSQAFSIRAHSSLPGCVYFFVLFFFLF